MEVNTKAYLVSCKGHQRVSDSTENRKTDIYTLYRIGIMRRMHYFELSKCAACEYRGGEYI